MDINLRELNFENIGSWPSLIKLAVVIILLILILFLGYWFDTSDQLQTLASYRLKETQLLKTLEVKQQQAANLANYQQQLDQINRIFHNLLRQLPTRSEVPGLLEDISKTGIATGLEFKLFKPLPEIQAAFYAELPIQISVVGDYHQIAQFISEVAGLDRIVTLHDFTIKPVTNKDDAKSKQAQLTGKLMLDITAKTYRYTGEQQAK